MWVSVRVIIYLIVRIKSFFDGVFHKMFFKTMIFLNAFNTFLCGGDGFVPCTNVFVGINITTPKVIRTPLFCFSF